MEINNIGIKINFSYLVVGEFVINDSRNNMEIGNTNVLI